MSLTQTLLPCISSICVAERMSVTFIPVDHAIARAGIYSCPIWYAPRFKVFLNVATCLQVQHAGCLQSPPASQHPCKVLDTEPASCDVSLSPAEGQLTTACATKYQRKPLQPDQPRMPSTLPATSDAQARLQPPRLPHPEHPRSEVPNGRARQESGWMSPIKRGAGADLKNRTPAL